MAQSQGYFLRPFGEPDPLEALQSDWEALAARIGQLPTGSRPDHVRLHFLQLATDLDAFVRHWSARADRHPRLAERLQTADRSLRNLLEQARAAFEAGERQRIEQQQARDRQRWVQLEQQRCEAEHQARLSRTRREIQDIYDNIRQQQSLANERRNALWKAAHFPETTCSCGRSKMPHHLFCWDCSPASRGW